MSSRRLERLGHQIREDISDLLQRQVNDPRLSRFISVTRVDIAPDLSQARVHVSVVGTEAERRDTLQGFTSAAGYFRRELGRRLSIRQVPELVFQLDDSIADGERVLGLINKVIIKPLE